MSRLILCFWVFYENLFLSLPLPVLEYKQKSQDCERFVGPFYLESPCSLSPYQLTNIILILSLFSFRFENLHVSPDSVNHLLFRWDTLITPLVYFIRAKRLLNYQHCPVYMRFRFIYFIIVVFVFSHLRFSTNFELRKIVFDNDDMKLLMLCGFDCLCFFQNALPNTISTRANFFFHERVNTTACRQL